MVNEEVSAAVDAVVAPPVVKAMAATAVGGGLTTIPPIDPSTLTDLPFYLGMTILAITATKVTIDTINSIITLRRNLRAK